MQNLYTTQYLSLYPLAPLLRVPPALLPPQVPMAGGWWCCDFSDFLNVAVGPIDGDEASEYANLVGSFVHGNIRGIQRDLFS